MYQLYRAQKTVFYRSPHLSLLSPNLLGGYQVFRKSFWKVKIQKQAQTKTKQNKISLDIFSPIFRNIKAKIKSSMRF